MKTEMREKKIWKSEFDGFVCEFVNWGAGAENWNYYVQFTKRNTPLALWEKLLAMDPGKYSIGYTKSWLCEIKWHRGITFAEFLYDSRGNVWGIKAGCDYDHAWYQDSYHLDDLISDCEATIDSVKTFFAHYEGVK